MQPEEPRVVRKSLYCPYLRHTVGSLQTNRHTSMTSACLIWSRPTLLLWTCLYLYIYTLEFLDSAGTTQVQHRSLSLFIYTTIYTLGLSSILFLPPPLLYGNLLGKHPSTRHGHESPQHLVKSAGNEYNATYFLDTSYASWNLHYKYIDN